ncbi:TonB-dependent receptor [Caulobacter sp. SLTY]|uniref:TonB-dependent receptor n=1 Tax=Caulobacter sp. SLTY TaxID=2683262 RepID=UPI00141324E8|nr:TonB-dependent receptor [Caulobacter sp. SLTY]NBB16732.1 TonB-dependent receptor [Caulobacter sp. SLTY]NBB16768.1 TonB-dependent receptor [Caulobacter sp. SLTY]
MRMSVLLAGASLAALSAVPALAQDAAPRGDVAEVVVTAAPYAISEDSATTSVAIIDRDALDVAPAGGLGDLLGGMPGLRSTSFGPGASRPVVRGLAGPRVSVLTNGVGLIDASALSPDHQVASDPGEASRIEVLRGPAALLYGGSAIGGVVNIFDDRIARTLPDRPVSGRFNASVSSVDDGYSTSGALRLTTGPIVFSFDFLTRESDDYRIPAYPESRQQLAAEGETAEKPFPDRLENSAVSLDTFGLGVSFVGDEGYFGLALKTVDTTYGVPGHAHEEPPVPPPIPEPEEFVTIGLEQTRLDMRGKRNVALGPFQTIRFSGGYADYTHTEFEGAEVGTVFTSKGLEGRLELVQIERDGWNGAVGVQALRRNFDAEGDEAYVPRTRIEELGVFTLQRVDLGGWGYEGGLRVDSRKLDSVVGERDFTNVSASAGVFVRPADDWFLGASISRTSRAPTEAELFADGPHVATRGYEIGDAALEEEVATSLEFTAHYGGERLSADLHVYGVRYEGFIDLTPTGAVIDDLDVFQYVQTDAEFYGFEAEGSWTAWQNGERKLKLEAGADYVKADSDLGPPPRIPPWSLTGRLVWEGPQLAAKLEVRHVAEQDRLAAFELPTDSYTQVNLGGSWSPPALEGVKLYAEVRNLTDEEIREHASFLKDLAPQPGRNFRAGIAWRF